MSQNIDLQIGLIMEAAKVMDLELLKSKYKEAENQSGIYGAIGILDGNPKYYNKFDLQSICLKRTKALIDLIEIVQETQSTIEKFSRQDLFDLGFMR